MALRAGYYGLKKSLLNKVKGLPGIKSIGSGLSLNSTTGELTATGTTVSIEANPEGSATDNLVKLGIGEDIYAVPDAAKTYQTDDATESAIVDSDYIPFLDSSAASGAGAPKKSTWSNFISKIKSKITEYVTWEANAVLGAGNFMPNTVYPLTFASTGNVRVETNNDAVSFIAPIDKNTHYYLSASAGNRFRVALSTDIPADGVNVDVIFSSESVLSKDFDSGNYNYVILLSNIGVIDTDTIKPLLAKFSNTLYAPYSMTNRDLSTPIKITGKTNIFSSSENLIDATMVKVGKVIQLRIISVDNASISGSWVTLGTLKEEYRPDDDINVAAIDNNAGTPIGWLQIKNTGAVNVYQTTGAAKKIVNTITYILTYQ